MKFCTDNVKDIDKYFRGTYVKFMGMSGVFSDGTECAPAEELVHSIDTIQSNVIKGKRLENGETVPYQFLLYAEAVAPAPEVEFILPKKSYFNTDEGACLLSRIPARQYRRGICNDNTSIALLKGNTHTERGVDLALLDKYVRKPQPYTFQVRDVSYAVSRRIAVATTGAVFVDSTQVGTINYEHKRLHVLPLFMPEFLQVLRDLGQTDWTVMPPVAPVKKKPGAVKKPVVLIDDNEF